MRYLLKWVISGALLLSSSSLLAEVDKPAKNTPPVAAAKEHGATVLNSKPTRLGDASTAPIQVTRHRTNGVIDPNVLQGYQQLRQGHYTQAQASYAQALQRLPYQRDALLGMAYVQHAQRQTEQAISTLRQLLELYPEDSQGISALYLMSGGDPVAEETRFKQLIELSAQPAPLLYAIGVLYFEQSRFGEAERAFARACAINPQNADYAFNWALTLDRLNRDDESARQYSVALNLASQSNAAFNREQVHLRLRALTTQP